MDSFITRYDDGSPSDAECEEQAGSCKREGGDVRVQKDTSHRLAALEDSIMHKGRLVTAGSRMLESFVSPLDAEVVTRLEAAGVRIIGKTCMDEFGVAGLFSDAAATASGAVSAVAEGIAAFALCNDYTGAIRQQAALSGVCYIHPTYGTVSRYGLIPAVPSMDQIGLVCKTPEEGFDALSIISGHDPKDGAMFACGSELRVESGEPRVERGEWREESGEQSAESGELKIGVPVNVLDCVSSYVRDAVNEFVKGYDTVDIELKHFELYAQVMQILCCAELSSSLCRYDGVKFGYRADGYSDLNELYTKSRTEAFGADVKLATIVGAMALSQEYYGKYYDKAMRIRRMIKESLDFDKYDAIILPVADASSAERLALSALPQLCGFPSVTIPLEGAELSIIANVRREDVLQRVCARYATDQS